MNSNVKGQKNTVAGKFNVTTKDFKRSGLLGKGSYAEVFLVERVDKKDEMRADSTRKYYAMKRMKKRQYQGLTRFVITEKEVQRKLEHRYMTKLYYAFQTFDYLYLVSDYCPGGDMRHVIT
jgi:serine/threonine protein kinase